MGEAQSWSAVMMPSSIPSLPRGRVIHAEYGLRFIQLDDRSQSCLMRDIRTIHDKTEKRLQP